MYRPLAGVCLTLGCSLSLVAGWDPIPPEVWAIKEDPTKGIRDAVILENRVDFKITYVEYRYRVRVLTEAGKAAANFPAFSEESYAFEGRTVYPDGKVVVFSKRKDFQEVKERIGDEKLRRHMVVPPGVTSNCVVELTWKESADHEDESPLPRRFLNNYRFQFGAEYFTQLETITIPRMFPYPWSIAPSRTMRPESFTEGSTQVITMKAIPAFPEEPFSIKASRDRPVFMAFYQPPALSKASRSGPDDYWAAVGRNLYSYWFKVAPEKGGAYRELRDRLVGRCTAQDPQVRASQIEAIIKKEFINVEEMTHAEQVARPKDAKTPRWLNLNEMASLKVGGPNGLRMLLFHLLQDAKCAPKPVLVQDKYSALIQWRLHNPFQGNTFICQVDAPGQRPLFLDAGSRTSPTGLLHSDYQGVPALVLDPEKNFLPRLEPMPVVAPEVSSSRHEFVLTPGEDTCTFKVESTYTGAAEAVERYRYHAADEPGRNKQLKELVEARLKGATLDAVSVGDPLDFPKPFSLSVSGNLELAEGRRRSLYPFPGMASALYIPDSFPVQRQLPIVMPFLRVMEANSRIIIPPGHRITAEPVLVRGNLFGEVRWECQTKGQEAVVKCRVVLSTMVAAPAAQAELKAFLGWIDEAQRRMVQLEKE